MIGPGDVKGTFDAVVYFVTKNSDLDAIKAQNFKFKNVPNKFLIVEDEDVDAFHTAAELTLTIMDDIDSVPDEIY